MANKVIANNSEVPAPAPAAPTTRIGQLIAKISAIASNVFNSIANFFVWIGQSISNLLSRKVTVEIAPVPEKQPEPAPLPPVEKPVATTPTEAPKPVETTPAPAATETPVAAPVRTWKQTLGRAALLGVGLIAAAAAAYYFLPATALIPGADLVAHAGNQLALYTPHAAASAAASVPTLGAPVASSLGAVPVLAASLLTAPFAHEGNQVAIFGAASTPVQAAFAAPTCPVPDLSNSIVPIPTPGTYISFKELIQTLSNNLPISLVNGAQTTLSAVTGLATSAAAAATTLPSKVLGTWSKTIIPPVVSAFSQVPQSLLYTAPAALTGNLVNDSATCSPLSKPNLGMCAATAFSATESTSFEVKGSSWTNLAFAIVGGLTILLIGNTKKQDKAEAPLDNSPQDLDPQDGQQASSRYDRALNRMGIQTPPADQRKVANPQRPAQAQRPPIEPFTEASLQAYLDNLRNELKAQQEEEILAEKIEAFNKAAEANLKKQQEAARNSMVRTRKVKEQTPPPSPKIEFSDDDSKSDNESVSSSDSSSDESYAPQPLSRPAVALSMPPVHLQRPTAHRRRQTTISLEQLTVTQERVVKTLRNKRIPIHLHLDGAQFASVLPQAIGLATGLQQISEKTKYAHDLDWSTSTKRSETLNSLARSLRNKVPNNKDASLIADVLERKVKLETPQPVAASSAPASAVMLDLQPSSSVAASASQSNHLLISPDKHIPLTSDEDVNWVASLPHSQLVEYDANPELLANIEEPKRTAVIELIRGQLSSKNAEAQDKANSNFEFAKGLLRKKWQVEGSSMSAQGLLRLHRAPFATSTSSPASAVASSPQFSSSNAASPSHNEVIPSGNLQTVASPQPLSLPAAAASSASSAAASRNLQDSYTAPDDFFSKISDNPGSLSKYW